MNNLRHLRFDNSIIIMIVVAIVICFCFAATPDVRASPTLSSTQAESIKVAVIGYSNAGKSTFIGSIASYNNQSGVAPPVGFGAERGTAELQEYTIGDLTFYDTPGFHDVKKMDDKFSRELHESGKLNNLDLIVYCYKAGRAAAPAPLRYSLLFGAKTPVILVINDYPEDLETMLREATKQVEDNGLTVSKHFFLPPRRLIQSTDDIARLDAHIRESRRNPKKISFTAPPISDFAKKIVKLKLDIEADDAAISPREDKVWSSVGMGNGQEAHFEKNTGDRLVVSVRYEEPSVNDGDNNGYSRITKTSDSTYRIDARMPNKRGGFLDIGQEGQWRDANYFVTHRGRPDAALRQEWATYSQSEVTGALLQDIIDHFDYYRKKTGF